MIKTESFEETLTRCPLDRRVVCSKLVHSLEIAKEAIDQPLAADIPPYYGEPVPGELSTIGGSSAVDGRHYDNESFSRVLSLMSGASEYAKNHPCGECSKPLAVPTEMPITI